MARAPARTSRPADTSRCSPHTRASAGRPCSRVEDLRELGLDALATNSSSSGDRTRRACSPATPAARARRRGPRIRRSRTCRSRRRAPCSCPCRGAARATSDARRRPRGQRHDVGRHPHRAAAEDRRVVDDEREPAVAPIHVDGAEADRGQLDRRRRRSRARRRIRGLRTVRVRPPPLDFGSAAFPRRRDRPPSCVTASGAVASPTRSRAASAVAGVRELARDRRPTPPRPTQRASTSTTRRAAVARVRA